jgi:hypothetical protein
LLVNLFKVPYERNASTRTCNVPFTHGAKQMNSQLPMNMCLPPGYVLLLVYLCATSRSVGAAAATAAKPTGTALSHPDVLAVAAIAGVQPDAVEAATILTGRTAQQLQEQLQRDQSASLTSSGAVVYACNLHGHGHSHTAASAARPAAVTANLATILGPAGASEGVTAAAVTEDHDVPLGEAFYLHSMPSASRKIFLQFQGCITQVRRWYTITLPARQWAKSDMV